MAFATDEGLKSFDAENTNLDQIPRALWAMGVFQHCVTARDLASTIETTTVAFLRLLSNRCEAYEHAAGIMSR